MHKDQKRVRDALLPYVMDRVMDESAAAELDCTVLNRALLQGPDPLFLMETCPAQFERLCEHLFVGVDYAREGIELAHIKGPGVLLDGTGLPRDHEIEPTDPAAWKREAVWLVLASVSDCTEHEYSSEVTLLERFRRCMKAATEFALCVSNDVTTPVGDAYLALNKYLNSTPFETVNGIPVTDVDVGFYVGYKLGHKVVGVRSGDKTFFGTTPDTTLAEQGVKVDVNVSPSYGFVRHRG